MLSSQRLWPRSCRIRVAFMSSPLSRPDFSTSRSCAVPRMRMAGRDRQPCMPIARKQAIGGGGAGTAGGIIGEIISRSACPGIEDPLYGAPSRLDRIGPLEQGGVAYETIVDQRLVADRRQRREIVPVGKVHFDAVDFDLGAGALGAKTERQPFIRLDAQRQDVRGQSLDRGVAKEGVGRLTKLHRDLGVAGREVLAGAEIEWHAGPAPVVDAELERGIGFG